MRRKLFNVATALSLVLCVGASVLWVRSFATGDSFDWHPDRWVNWRLSVISGRAELMREEVMAKSSLAHATGFWHFRLVPGPYLPLFEDELRFAGFRFAHGPKY